MSAARPVPLPVLNHGGLPLSFHWRIYSVLILLAMSIKLNTSMTPHGDHEREKIYIWVAFNKVINETHMGSNLAEWHYYIEFCRSRSDKMVRF